MEDLLSYSRYEHLICFSFDEEGNINVHAGSSRAMNISLVLMIHWEEAINEDLGLLVRDIFKEFFELQPKDKHQLTETEMWTLYSILYYFEEIRLYLSEKSNIPFDVSQIIFWLPAYCVEDRHTDMLRTLFLETGWIAAEDDKNKLMLVPFVEAFVDFLHNSVDHQVQFERERKYILFTMCETEDWKKITYMCTCFKMQSAKELIAVSKALASSNFLLVPTILDNSRSICLPELDDVLLVAIKKLLTEMQTKPSKDAQYGHNSKDKREPKILEIASKLVADISKICASSVVNTAVVSSFLEQANLYELQLQDLRNLNCHQFMEIISLNANVQQYTTQVCDFMQSFIHECNVDSKSPDGGIQDIILHNGLKNRDHYPYFVKKALLRKKLVDLETTFIPTPYPYKLGESAIQKPLKMIQIANAILPPVILEDEDSDSVAFDTMQEDSSSFLSMNSYYVQVNIEEQQIKYILNKVIRMPSSKSAAKLFTVQEREISIDGLVGTASDEMWNHYQRLESEGHLGVLIDWCHEHEAILLSTRHYECFSTNMKKIVRAWCQNKQIFTNEELDAYHSVFINEQCACALKITRRMLLEVGMKPAIANVATTIVGFAISNDYFGLYQVSAWIVRGCMTSIVNSHYSYSLGRFLQEKLRKGLQIHQRKPLLFFDNDAEGIATQYLGRGGYSQVSSTTYTVKFEMRSNNNAYVFGLQNTHLDRCEDIPVRYKALEPNIYDFGVFSDYVLVLHKESILPEAGINKTFFFQKGRDLTISIYAQELMEDGVYPALITALWLFTGSSGGHRQLSVSIVPEHHSSSVKINMSHIGISERESEPNALERATAYYDRASVNFHERLHLKKL